MARNRTPHPSQVATALNNLAAAIRDHIALADAAGRLAAAVSPELMAVRHVDVADLGRWIEIPDPRPQEGFDPSVKVTAGRLVGIRPGETNRDRISHRVFVIQQGTEIAAVRVETKSPVKLV